MDIKLLSKVLCFIRPNAEFILDNNGLVWLDKLQTQPIETEIQAGLVAFNAAEAQAVSKAEADKEAAQAKLAALGLTADDLKALGL